MKREALLWIKWKR